MRRGGRPAIFFTGPLYRPHSQPKPCTNDRASPAMPYTGYMTRYVHEGSFQLAIARTMFSGL
jgi:hypothetical protein